jgi:hypothetical protein
MFCYLFLGPLICLESGNDRRLHRTGFLKRERVPFPMTILQLSSCPIPREWLDAPKPILTDFQSADIFKLSSPEASRYERICSTESK